MKPTLALCGSCARNATRTEHKQFVRISIRTAVTKDYLIFASMAHQYVEGVATDKILLSSDDSIRRL